METVQLFIAEKPAMGRSIAAALPGRGQSKEGYIEGQGWLVTWCVGHLLEQVPPEEYDDTWKAWSLDTLPMIPLAWKLRVSSDKDQQVKIIKGLLSRCTEVVHACDAGREGQGIADELLGFLKNRKPVKRLILSSLDAPSIRRALGELTSNEHFASLYQSFLGRQRADWLVGMNMTRAFSVLARKAGYDGVLSVGRVQSPTLAIVAKRDQAIASFVPTDYWTVSGTFADPGQAHLPFAARFAAPKISEASEDDEADDGVQQTGDRFATEADAQRVVDAVKSAGTATVTRYESKRVSEPAPMPFELTGLQTYMNKKYGHAVKATLDAAQGLYERGLISYPRTDCPWLPTAQLGDAPAVLAALGQGIPRLANHIGNADVGLVSRAWNDSKLGEHHALIPTASAPGNLSGIEADVYHAISERYVAQFLQDCQVDKAKVELDAAGHTFVAAGRVVRSPGWRVLFGVEETPADTPALPALTQGQNVGVVDAASNKGRTSPPPRYTQGSLLDAMRHVHRLVDDPVERKKLQALEGIGRSATRAAIVETLLKRGFVAQDGKQLKATPLGLVLCNVLPSSLTDPGTTARWETLLDGVALGEVDLDRFEAKMHETVTRLVAEATSVTLPPPPPGCEAKPRTQAPADPKPKGAKACPTCGKGHLVQKTAKASGKKFMGCSAWPSCKHTEWPK